jgi:hypothetical protein
MALNPHPLVVALAKNLKAPAVRAAGNVPGIAAGSPGALARASNLPGVVLFAGFLGDLVPHPSGTNWQVLYIDLALTEWLLIEEDGILDDAKVKDETVPIKFGADRDVLWVKADASVGRGAASQSVEAQFLTGPFTRAGDFEVPLAGGTLAAATGVFCEARTPSCCRVRSRPY